jgi:hypothetical protein
MSIKGVDCRLSLSSVRHSNKTKALATTSHPIGDNTNGSNFTELRERRFKSLVIRRISEVTNIDFH